MDEDLTFGQWLRRSRKAGDLTQTELAAEVSCAVGTVRKLEADELRPSKELALRLAAHFDVPAAGRATFVAFVDRLDLPTSRHQCGMAARHAMDRLSNMNTWRPWRSHR